MLQESNAKRAKRPYHNGDALFWSEEVRAIRSLYLVNGLTMSYIARELGVGYTTIMKICRHLTYQDVIGEPGERFFHTGDALNWKAWMMKLKREREEGLGAEARREKRMEEERMRNGQAKRV